MKGIGSLLIIASFSILLFAQNPEWQWAVGAGGSWYDQATSVVTDSLGNIYVAGHFSDTITLGTTMLTSSGFRDIFIAKLNPQGSWLWAVRAGGSSDDRAKSIVFINGHLYVTGQFRPTADFGPFILQSTSTMLLDDIFVAKLDAYGNWVWAVNVEGGNYVGSGKSITADNEGNLYVTGSITGSANFGNITITCVAMNDIFIAKLDSNGNWLWAHRAGGPALSQYNYGNCVVTDNNGGIYVTGDFSGMSDFGPFTLSGMNAPGEDIFIVKLDSEGNWLWARQAGGTNEDHGNSICFDAAGCLLATGFFGQMAQFGSFTLTSSGLGGVYVAKLDSLGNWLWVSSAAPVGINLAHGYSITNGPEGTYYVTGIYSSITVFGSSSLISCGFFDIFIAKLDNSGNWMWAIAAGGPQWDNGVSITTDVSGSLIISGDFREVASFGSTFLTAMDSEADMFIAKLYFPVLNDDNFSSDVTNEIINCYPNPFNTETRIQFFLQNKATAQIGIYNIKGQKVTTLETKADLKNMHSIVWNGTDSNGKTLGSGLYFVRLEQEQCKSMFKIMLAR